MRWARVAEVTIQTNVFQEIIYVHRSGRQSACAPPNAMLEVDWFVRKEGRGRGDRGRGTGDREGGRQGVGESWGGVRGKVLDKLCDTATGWFQ